MWFINNILFALVLIGLLTRLTNWFYRKRMTRIASAYLSFITVVLPIFIIMSLIVGVDHAIVKFISASILWLFFDLLRIGLYNRAMKKKK